MHPKNMEEEGGEGGGGYGGGYGEGYGEGSDYTGGATNIPVDYQGIYGAKEKKKKGKKSFFG